jgi:hypothetical protein
VGWGFYKHGEEEVLAVQWEDPDSPPDVVRDATFYSLYRANGPGGGWTGRVMLNDGGHLGVTINDWVVVHNDSSMEVMNDRSFKRLYVPSK